MMKSEVARLIPEDRKGLMGTNAQFVHFLAEET